jgi:hypothetical protein
MSKFTVAGVSGQNGVIKVRFANDIVSRTKLLSKGGHSPLELVELPKAMTKAEACQFLLKLDTFKAYTDLISETMDKKNGVVATKVKAVTPAKTSKPVSTSKAKPAKVIAPKVEEDLEVTEIKELAA